ncbi:hypothetical protein P4S72_03745 [Vibrio sp. PP-XX7]
MLHQPGDGGRQRYHHHAGNNKRWGVCPRKNLDVDNRTAAASISIRILER